MALYSNGTLKDSAYAAKREPVSMILSAGLKPGCGKSIPVIRSFGGPP
ncbi:hypothetical protein A2U01_0110620, partial [Trifolium medium]|nr:hypothetical protein [Trifolium medium]